MSKHKTVKWDDVLPAAEVAFSIWVGQPEIRWAKEAWGHIIKAELANYANGLEYCKVCLRFLALADIYYDWCSIVWDEDHDYSTILVASEDFEISPFRLGQLVGPNKMLEDNATEDGFVIEAICPLVSAVRVEVVQAILSGFGDATGLFISLLNSDKAKREETITGNWELNDVEFSWINAYSWIDQGCRPWREESMG
ncbi:MAG: hypothetical protein U5R49_12140 [Deltaproteobacteria bacterium]|nr:hypothetical protein [Deltaproteobacteria bacterium]